MKSGILYCLLLCCILLTASTAVAEPVAIDTPEALFASSGINELNQKAFLKLNTNGQLLVYDYYRKGLANNTGISDKEKKFFANNLIEYFESLHNMNLYIDEYRKGNKDAKFKGGVSLEFCGYKIDKYSKLSTGLPEKGKQIDKIFFKIVGERIRQADESIRQDREEIRQTDERIRQTDERIRQLDKSIRQLDELINVLDRLITAL